MRIVTSLALLIVHQAFAGTTTVRIDFIEALSPKDTTSSTRFQKNYEATIDLARSLVKSRLQRCGYELITRTSFYEANDPLQGKEIATKADGEGTWLLVGPRRSNHYLLLAQGAGATPTISLMASSDDIAKLGSSHLSLSPTNSQLATIAAKEARTRAGRGATYINVVSDDCTTCVDFSERFDSAAKKLGLRKLDQIKVRGESFETEQLRAVVSKMKPRIVLLPNYSMVASRVMNALIEVSPAPLYVGGDGWGDDRYGFVQSGLKSEVAQGLTVRGFPPVELGLGSFALGKEASKSDLPFTGPYVGIMKIIGEVADELCDSHPTSRNSFASMFKVRSARRLRAPWGASVYELKAGQLSFQKTVSVRE